MCPGTQQASERRRQHDDDSDQEVHPQGEDRHPGRRDREGEPGRDDADPGEDGGTCNLDTPAIRVPGMPDRLMQELAERIGIRLSDYQWFGGQRYYWVSVAVRGQANRRSTMSQAAVDKLRELLEDYDWVTVSHYMQMD